MWFWEPQLKDFGGTHSRGFVDVLNPTNVV